MFDVERLRVNAERLSVRIRRNERHDLVVLFVYNSLRVMSSAQTCFAVASADVVVMVREKGGTDGLNGGLLLFEYSGVGVELTSVPDLRPPSRVYPLFSKYLLLFVYRTLSRRHSLASEICWISRAGKQCTKVRTHMN